MTVKKGDKVKVHYKGTLDDGTIFDDSERTGQPIEFVAGEGKVIKGFDNAVMGMKKGEEKDINLKPEEAYGHRRDELIQKVPKDRMPAGQEIKKGMMLAMKSPDGQQFPVMVYDVDEKDISIDMNHPLAGKNLTFKIKIHDIQ